MASAVASIPRQIQDSVDVMAVAIEINNGLWMLDKDYAIPNNAGDSFASTWTDYITPLAIDKKWIIEIWIIALTDKKLVPRLASKNDLIVDDLRPVPIIPNSKHVCFADGQTSWTKTEIITHA